MKHHHWLKIKGTWTGNAIYLAMNNVREYLKKYPGSVVTVYRKEFSLLDRYILLECSQNYQELDLDCNSMTRGSVIHLSKKPKGLELCPVPFEGQYNYAEEHYKAERR